MTDLEIVDEIRQRMESLGMSQADLARETGLSVGTVNRMMANGKPPSRGSSQEAISKALRWSPKSIAEMRAGVRDSPARVAQLVSDEMPDDPSLDGPGVAQELREMRAALADMQSSFEEMTELLRAALAAQQPR